MLPQAHIDTNTLYLKPMHYRVVQNMLVPQSCPRVTFLGRDQTRPGETLTRPAIADKKSDPTRPDLRPDSSPILLVLRLPSYASVTQLMHDRLHWLDVPQRIKYKLCVLTFKCIHKSAPGYLSRQETLYICVISLWAVSTTICSCWSTSGSIFKN